MKHGVATQPVPLQAAHFKLTARRVFLLLAGYFLLHALARALVSDSAELDESEQLLAAQQWAWGYSSDPPLYIWLQIVTFKLFGTNILALALLKNVLLFSAFAFTYLATREISRDESTAVVAMLSLLLFPQVTWESQRDLTHSVLAITLVAATFYVATRVVNRRRPLDYVLLGLCAGLTALSKHNATGLLVALAVAALSVRTLRPVVLNKWMLAALAIALFVAAGHFTWLRMHPEIAMRRSQEVIGHSTGSFLITRMLGLVSMIKCVVMLAGVLATVYWLVFGNRPVKRPSPETALFQQWIGRTFCVVALAGLLVVLVVGLELRDRWFQPVVFLGAISAALWASARLGGGVEKRFGRVASVIGVIVLVVLPAIPLAASVTRRPTRLNAPYSALSAQLKGAVGEPGVIVASTRLVGGNLRLWFRQSTVVAPELHALPTPLGVPWLIVWDANKSETPPPALVKLVMDLRGMNLAELAANSVEAPFKYTRAKAMKLAYVTLPTPKAQ